MTTVRTCVVCRATFTPEMVVEQGRLRPRRRQTCSLPCYAELQRMEKKPPPPTAEELRQQVRERELMIAATVNAPKLADLESRLDFYQKRGLEVQVRLLKQQINELLGV